MNLPQEFHDAFATVLKAWSEKREAAGAGTLTAAEQSALAGIATEEAQKAWRGVRIEAVATWHQRAEPKAGAIIYQHNPDGSWGEEKISHGIAGLYLGEMKAVVVSLGGLGNCPQRQQPKPLPKAIDEAVLKEEIRSFLVDSFDETALVREQADSIGAIAARKAVEAQFRVAVTPEEFLEGHESGISLPKEG